MIKLNKEKCKGCGVCAKICPQLVFVLEDGKAYFSALNRCMECGACELNCEFDAIKVTKGTGCLFAIIREDILKSVPKRCGCGDGVKSKSC